MLFVLIFPIPADDSCSSYSFQILTALDTCVDIFYIVEMYMRLFHFMPIDWPKSKGIPTQQEITKSYMSSSDLWIDLLATTPFDTISFAICAAGVSRFGLAQTRFLMRLPRCLHGVRLLSYLGLVEMFVAEKKLMYIDF